MTINNLKRSCARLQYKLEYYFLFIEECMNFIVLFLSHQRQLLVGINQSIIIDGPKKKAKEFSLRNFENKSSPIHINFSERPPYYPTFFISSLCTKSVSIKEI